jgi:hypothetical protein
VYSYPFLGEFESLSVIKDNELLNTISSAGTGLRMQQIARPTFYKLVYRYMLSNHVGLFAIIDAMGSL